MSSRNWKMRIQDILLAISAIQQRTVDKTLRDLQSDETITKTTLYDFMIIGEATRTGQCEVLEEDSRWSRQRDLRKAPGSAHNVPNRGKLVN